MNVDYNIAVIAGDGIGPDIIKEARKVLKKIGVQYNHVFHLTDVLAGGCAIDEVGEPLPKKTVELCLQSDAVLLGAVGGPKWDMRPGDMRPERALLGLREKLGLYANLRPAVLYDDLLDACPLRPSIAQKGIDMMMVRELTGGMYFGERGRRMGNGGEEAFDTECYSALEVRRIAKCAFELARSRRKKLVNIDKANVLESSRLWREVVLEVGRDYLDVELTHMYVDNAAMQLVKDPQQFDVIVTTNMFGDILSDEASQITGSIGMLPSASLGDSSLGMYEPIHGSAPDIAGKDLANPIATILSVAMMLRHSFHLLKEAQAIENAVKQVLAAGYRTVDLSGENIKQVGTRKMGQLITDQIK